MFSLHAAATSTPRVSLPQIKLVSVLSHATVHTTQDGTLLNQSLGEVDVTSVTALPCTAPNQQAPSSPARFRHRHRQPWMTLWLSSSPLQGCNLTTSSLSDPMKSEDAAAPELEASYDHQCSALFQVHAETQTHSIPAPHSAGCSLDLLDMLHGGSCQSLLTKCYP